jgi:hypothetical protein
MMSKKHYNQLAKILGEINRYEEISPEWITSALIGFMVEDNPRFDRVRFWEAMTTERDKEQN